MTLPAPTSPPPSPSPTPPAPAVSFESTATAFVMKSDAQLRKAYLLFAALERPLLSRLGIPVTTALLRWRVPGARLAVRHTVFAQFCGGESIRECQGVVEALGAHGVQSILDYSAEGEHTEEGFEAAMRETLATIECAASRRHIPFSVFKVTGIARFALLEKLDARQPLTAEEQAEWERVRARVLTLCGRAHALGVRIFVDAEESWIQDTVDALAEEMMARFNRERPIVHNTYQFYRHASLANLEAALARAEAGGYFFGAKLVRGAYMEKERRRAGEKGYRDPIQPDKASTDRDYDAGVSRCLAALERASFCAGTHNEESCARLMREMAARGVAPSDARVWFSQLYGMSDNLSFNLAAGGYNVAKYLPYGPVRAVLPYLVRRAQENSAIAGQGGREAGLIRRELARRRQAPRAALPAGGGR